MIGRRLFLGALGAAPIAAKSALNEEPVQMPHMSSAQSFPDPSWVDVEEDPALTEFTDGWRRKFSRRWDTVHDMNIRRFDHMKSWSYGFKHSVIRDEVSKIRDEQNQIEKIMYDPNISLIEKTARIGMIRLSKF